MRKNTRQLLSAAVCLLLLVSFDAKSQIEIAKIPVDWLKGDQPKLLNMMASSPSTREGLEGSSMSLTAIAGGWHAQAIGQYKDYVYIAFSDGTVGKGNLAIGEKNPPGQLWIYNIKTKESHLLELEKGYAHPCSIQITGKYLTVTTEAEYGVAQGAGVDRENKSLIQIFDLSKDPKCSVEVARITQNETNSGGAGLSYSPVNKCWYMLVDQASKNFKRVALYKTEDENIANWIKDPVAYYQRYGTGAGLNLLTATDNSIWGLYFDNEELHDKSLSTYDIVSDYVQMFMLVDATGKLVETRNVYKQKVNISSPRVKGVGELLADRPGMRFGASLRNEGGKLELLTCQRNMNKTFNIDRVKLKEGNRTQVMFANLAKAKGEAIISSKSSSENYTLKKNQSESEAVIVSSPAKGDLNYLSEKSISKPKLGSLKSLKQAVEWTDALESESSAPLVFFYLEGLTDISGKMMEFYAEKKSDTLKQ